MFFKIIGNDTNQHINIFIQSATQWLCYFRGPMILLLEHILLYAVVNSKLIKGSHPPPKRRFVR
jgi:hypothetical protein